MNPIGGGGASRRRVDRSSPLIKTIGIKRIKGAKYVIVPQTQKTHGHFTHLRTKFLKQYLAEFMKELEGG